MWSYKKHKRLTDRLSATQQKLSSSSYQYSFLQRYNTSSSMPYLRGSKSNVRSRKSTLAGKLARLERQVNKQKPEIRHFINTGAVTTASSTPNVLQVNCTRDLIDDASFRSIVSGDHWNNHSLYIRASAPAQGTVERCRLVVYSMLRAGTTSINFPGGSTGYSYIPDPTIANILYDNTFVPLELAGAFQFSALIRCPRLTAYNSTDNVIDRNPIQFCLITETPTGLASVLNYSYRLLVSDK